jgi:phosphoribosylanthranilate isomerase
MTWVKVCGLKSAGDVEAAVSAGADAIGFNNVPASPRYLSLDDVTKLAADLPVATILLTIDLAPDVLVRVLASAGVDGVQPYGEHRREAAQAARDAGYIVLYPVRAGPDLDTSGLPGIPLLDTPSPTKLGGTGRTFDWSLARNVPGDFVLAGGLGPHNVEEAIRLAQPWGVDAASGLEMVKGRKDHSMVADFIAKAKMK